MVVVENDSMGKETIQLDQDFHDFRCLSVMRTRMFDLVYLDTHTQTT